MSMVQHNTTKLSRRAALAGLMILPAAATAARAPSGDADLLALEPAFTPLFAAWVRHRAAEQAEYFRFQVALERRTGIKLLDVPPFSDDTDEANDGRRAYYKIRAQHTDAAYAEVGGEYKPAFDHDDLEDRLREATADILSREATTLEGLALQAKALFCDCADGLEIQPEYDGEAEHPSLRAFLCSIFALTRTPWPYRSYGELLAEREA